MSFTTLDLTWRGPVLTVTLRNPPRSLMTPTMLDELDTLTRHLEIDPSVRVVVLTGATDEAFITHFDLEALGALARGARADLSPRRAAAAVRAVGIIDRLPFGRRVLGASPAAVLQLMVRFHQVFARMNRMDKVFVAAINGLALGGGFELALACDLRIAADRPTTRIGLPEPLLGIIPCAGGTQRLTHTVGTGRALALLLEGAALSAPEAAALGLVQEAVPDAHFDDHVRQTAERLATRQPRAIAAAKRAVNEGGTLPMRRGVRVEAAACAWAAGALPTKRLLSDVVRRYPSNEPLSTLDYLAEASDWQYGVVPGQEPVGADR